MKNLRQMLRHSRWLNNEKRHRRSQRSNSGQPRRLSSEALEKRELLAGDFAPAHNYWNRFDVDSNQEITSVDALKIINRLGQQQETREAEQVGEGEERIFWDVNADNELTAADALGVINAMGRGEEVGELVEYFITIRDLDDNEIAPVGGSVPVGVGIDNRFKFEVAYDDLRTFGDGIGVFQSFTDTNVSVPGAVLPVLNETQRIVVGEEIRTASSGSLIFGLEGSATTYESPLSAFGNDPTAEVANALAAFGYSPTDFSISTLDFGNDDVGRQIKYIGNDKGNVDLPDITLTETFDVAVPTQFIEIAPFEADGVTPNSDAIRFNLDVNSRTFNDNSPFFSSQNRGTFTSADGFDGLGGLGGVPTDGGGVPELANNGQLIEPFDIFSLVVYAPAAATFDLSVIPGTDPEATLLYGRDDAVPSDMVLIDEDATVTVVAGDVGNQAPVISGPISQTFTEDDAAANVSLLTNASDPDGDTLTISTPTITGNQAGISVSGSTLTVTPTAYGALNDGQSEVITLNYNVLDGNGGSTPHSATITVTGITDAQNQAPVVSGPISQTFTEDDAAANVSLLTNASDPDGDTLTISTPTITGNQAGISVSGSTLTVTPTAYGALNDGQSEVITLNYNVLDGNGGSTPHSATITVTGITDAQNQAPVVSGPISQTFTEDDAAANVSLLTNASDPDGDTLTISTPTITGNQAGISVSGSTLTVTPTAYGALNDGQSEVITLNYNVLDGNGGSTPHSATITVTGITDAQNQAPVVSGPISQTFTEDDAAANVSLLTNASDPDGDTLTISTPTITGNQAGISVSGSTLTVTPTAYGALNDGQSEVITLNYNVLDGNGGSTPHSATITVTGITDVTPNRAPVGGNVAVQADEDTPITYPASTILRNSTDADGDAITIRSVVSPTTAGGTAVLNGDGSVTYTPAADYFGADSFGVTIQDPSVATDDLVVSVNVRSVNDLPVARRDDVDAFLGSTLVIPASTLLANDSPGPANESDQTISVFDVTNLPSTNGTAVLNADGSVSFTPSGTGVTTFNYRITDGTNQSVAAAVFVTVSDFNPTTVSGSIFVDKIDNADAVIGGAAASRNGIQDANDDGLGGIPVHLTPTGDTGGDTITTLTGLDGGYDFTNVRPGTYSVSYELPAQAIGGGPASSPITIGPDGGVQTVPSVALDGLGGAALNSADILVSSYLRANPEMAASSNNGREGGTVGLDSDGVQNLFVAKDGFDGVEFAELALSKDSAGNIDGEAALLTVIKDGQALTARLSSNHFVISRDQSAVQFFGGLNDFNFVEDPTDILERDFPDFFDTINRANNGNVS